MNIDTALDKLNTLLPLKARQDCLETELQTLHRNILLNFAYSGQALNVENKEQLEILSKNDLIVWDDQSNKIIGAYPFSLKETAHHVSLNIADGTTDGIVELYAMCAFDAVSIAPVFGISTKIISHCHSTKEKIEINQDANTIKSIKPSEDIYIGIKWQQTGSCAAESLCMEMVFLKDKKVAKEWESSDENINVFPLDEAIEFSINYFKPLIDS